jgi:aspartyl-tRNA(Asn)/glutamyl-tRNA(Gln) amidotransferase subunit B
VRLTRAHLEEDAGKSLHEDFHGMSGIDLNRAGTPLLEIVSEPEMRSAAEAVAYAKALHSLVRWIGICDGNMQEGSFRCDANVSVRRPGEPLGTRCEIKNLNSFRFLEKAIEYEVRRQIDLIEDGGKVVQETRLFDPDRGETRPMRSKEDAHDYRYFPDPDLLPLEITSEWIEAVQREMPVLPQVERIKFGMGGISPYDAALLIESREKMQFAKTTIGSMKVAAQPMVAHWVNGEVSALANDRGTGFEQLPVSPESLARLLDRIQDGTISAKAAKEVLHAMAAGEGEPDAIIERRGLRQISDAGAIESAVDAVIAANAKLVDDYRAGKEKAFNALVGQVMKATQGKANPAQAGEILRGKLKRG